MQHSDLFAIAPTQLVQAREFCHAACQWPSKAARANLVAADDDSHSNLGWNSEHQALVSHPLDSAQQIQLGFSFDSQALIWLVNGKLEAQLVLGGSAAPTIQPWVDTQLDRVGLKPLAHGTMPYTLDDSVPTRPVGERQAEVKALGAWFGFGASTIERLLEQQSIGVSAPQVRCWPHHFDLGALLMLEAGDPETARSVGLGMSPGDGSFAQPYFYCSPWPAPEVATLPAMPGPFAWHTQGFVSAVATAKGLEGAVDFASGFRDALTAVVGVF